MFYTLVLSVGNLDSKINIQIVKRNKAFLFHKYNVDLSIKKITKKNPVSS